MAKMRLASILSVTSEFVDYESHRSHVSAALKLAITTWDFVINAPRGKKWGPIFLTPMSKVGEKPGTYLTRNITIYMTRHTPQDLELWLLQKDIKTKVTGGSFLAGEVLSDFLEDSLPEGNLNFEGSKGAHVSMFIGGENTEIGITFDRHAVRSVALSIARMMDGTEVAG
jgi:hypothetical protein